MSEQKKSNEEFCVASYEASKHFFLEKIHEIYPLIFNRIQAATTPNELDYIQANLAGEVAKSIKSPYEEFKTTCQLLDNLHPEAKFSYLAHSQHFSMVMFNHYLSDLISCVGHKRQDLSRNQESDDSPVISLAQICQASYETSRQSFLGELQAFYKNTFEMIQNVKTIKDLDAIRAKLANDIAKFSMSPCEKFKTTCQNMDALIPEAERQFLAESEHFSSAMIRDNVFDLMACIDHKREDIARLQIHNQNQVTSEQRLFGSRSKAHENVENKEPKKPGFN